MDFTYGLYSHNTLSFLMAFDTWKLIFIDRFTSYFIYLSCSFSEDGKTKISIIEIALNSYIIATPHTLQHGNELSAWEFK